MRWWEFSSTSSTSACIPVLPNPLGPVSHEKNAILESLGKDMKAFKLLLLPPGLLPEWEFFSIFYPHRVNRVNYSTMYHVQPLRLFRSSIPKQNPSHHDHVICDGSPSRIRMVRRISLGMTTRPRSSIRLTMPVAFIYILPPVVEIP